MIVNIPTPTDLNSSALRLHFSAWEAITSIENDFLEYFYSDGDWSNERVEYLELCRSDLQAICITIAQANELGLKAKIADVSPFLLLIGSGYNFHSERKDIDFSSFRTIDAVDLPNMVNSVCSIPVTEKFRDTYRKVRAVRNAVTHIGESSQTISINQLVEYLVVQYETLWPDRLWLKDYVENSSRTRLSFFDDGKHWTTEAGALVMWKFIRRLLTNGQHKRLIGKHKSTRRYLCPKCFEAASVRNLEIDVESHGTAFFDGKDSVSCVMCGEVFLAAKGSCCVPECKGSVFWKDCQRTTPLWCLSCAGHQSE